MHTDTGTRYRQITIEERYQIMAYLQTGKSQSEIATMLNRSRSTISREIQRNGTGSSYDPTTAHTATENRRRTAEKATKTAEFYIDISLDMASVAGKLVKGNEPRYG